MDALVAIAVGFLLGSAARLLGVAWGPAWMACVAVLGIGLVLVVAARSSSARPSRRAVVPLASCAAMAGDSIAPGPGAEVDLRPGVLRLFGSVDSTTHDGEPGAIVEVDTGSEVSTRANVPRGTRVRVRGLDEPPGT